MFCTMLEVIEIECPPTVYGMYFYTNHEHTMSFGSMKVSTVFALMHFHSPPVHMYAFQTSIVS